MRYLSPNDFGAVAMVTVITGFLQTFANSGLGLSLIYKDDVENLDKSTVFVTQVFMGILLATIVFFSAYPISVFYQNDQLVNITRWLSILFIINSLGRVSSSLLRKELKFKEIFYATIISALAGSGIAIYLVLNDFGLYSIIAQYIVTAIVINIMFLILNGEIPELKFSRDILKGHLDYSLPLFGNNFLNYWSKNSDNLIVGKFLGSSDLGIYSRSYTFMMIPARRLTISISGVLFPALVKIKNDIPQLKKKYVQLSALIAMAITPVMTSIIIAAKPFVMVVIGPEWSEMILTFQILSIVGWIQAITMVNNRLFMVLNKNRMFFKITVLSSIISVIGYLIGAQFSIEWVAFSYVVVTLIISLISYIAISKAMNSSSWFALKGLLPYFLILTFLISSGLYLVDKFYSESWYFLIATVLIVILTYLCLIYFFRKKDLNLFIDLIKKYGLKS